MLALRVGGPRLPVWRATCSHASGGAMDTETAVRNVRVFVCSPSDVAPERARVRAVAAKLNRDFEGIVRFETVRWEEHFYKADRSFQPQIPEPVACDVLVSMFWTRIGTELPAEFAVMANGKPYPSGTTYELLTALAASRAKGVPDVYVFRKTADAPLPTTDLERRRQAESQWNALEAFWSEWFRAEDGQFKAAFQTFATTDEFERQVEQLLRQWLESRGLLGKRLRWPKEKGSPFRGLVAFEAEHAAVFFGRERMIHEAQKRLTAAAGSGSRFLLIVGASGSGKSSLARAGLIPRLTTPGVIAGVDLWRVAIMKPSDGQSGPVASLATALFAALPEIAQGDFGTSAILADNLRRGGPAAARPIMRAIARVGEAAQRERNADAPLRVAVVLLADQLEELFAQAVSDAERTAFGEALKQLVATGQVWCVATLRADLYELMLKQPSLKAMKETGASLDLGPPDTADLADIVRAPAAAAGLVFETDAPHGPLDVRLLADAKTADSLPLLQFTLRQLYEHRVEHDGETTLTHAAYDELGGLKGAIAVEAERAVASLPPGTIDALPRLLRQLAEPARDGRSLTLREATRAEAATEVSETALADALLGARIVIAGQDAAGRPTLRLAHDAVLTSWPKAEAAAQASREFYRIRSDVEDALRRWQEHRQPSDRLIQPGVPLAEAEKLAADFSRELPAELVAYVGASRRRARVRQRLVAGAAVFFFALAVVALALGYQAHLAKQVAEQATERAVAAQAQAEASKKQAVDSEQRAVAAKEQAVASEERAVAAKNEAEHSRDSERMAKNFIGSVAETLAALSGFVPEETEVLMRETTQAILEGDKLDPDKVTMQQIDALEEMARHFYESWDGERVVDFLNHADERLKRVGAQGMASPKYIKLEAGWQEIAGDHDADDSRNYANAEREYQQALTLFDQYRAADPAGALDSARLHRKLAAIKSIEGDKNNAALNIVAAGQLLTDSDETSSERAALNDLKATVAVQAGDVAGAERLLQAAVTLDRKSLDKARQTEQPILRLSELLAIHLQHLGDVLRGEHLDSARAAYDEAEVLTNEILETYPNQAGVRFIRDLIRHGRSHLAGKPGAKADQAGIAADPATDIDANFAQGFGRFKFGMSTAQVNALLDHRFGTIVPAQLPRAAEYRTGEVHYFWVAVADLPEFRNFYAPVASCLNASMDYVVFMFDEDSLMRISFRLYGPPGDGNCGPRKGLFPDLAERFHMPLLGTPKQWRLGWETSRASVIGTTFKEGPMLDFIVR